MTSADDLAEGEGYALVMPFIACTSQGGPYDDNAFTAGYQCGRIDMQLAAAAATEGAGLTKVSVRTDLLPQLDLIAMRHGFVVDSEPWGEDGFWTIWTARRSSDVDD